MAILSLLIFFVVAFAGYVLGRFGDYYLNFWMKDPAWAPHHWIYGLIIVLIGIFFFDGNFELWAVGFGVGIFISDFKDFWDFKLAGKDNKDKSQRRFWHID